MFLFPEAMRQKADLWIKARTVERAIVVHEIGHVLGLVSHPGHTARGNPAHCTEPDCVMTYHRTRSWLYNALPAIFAGRVPDDYGPACREDLSRAPVLWSQRVVLDPGAAEALRTERRIADLRRRACWYAQHERWGEALREANAARSLGGEVEAEAPRADEDAVQLVELCPPGS